MPQAPLLRIIPALAGNTVGRGCLGCLCRDHPRSRGEYMLLCTSTCRSVGSSPLSRGIPRSGIAFANCAGIIPALAGNTRTLLGRPGRRWDHPRSRGEYPLTRSHAALNAGSSPLSRGIRDSGLPAPCHARIIPALAGNTDRRGRELLLQQDHPRSRGEYVFHPSWMNIYHGSSPLSRGIPARCWRRMAPTRIIPALAGNTPRAAARLSKRKDHPRSRGEYPEAAHRARRSPGSSPLSRGIRVVQSGIPIQHGIIPALAGNTDCVCKLRSLFWDHPRSRGEYNTPNPTILRNHGSSPLSRGIPCEQPHTTPGRRIIPALAGNTDEIRLIQMHNGDHPRSRGEYFNSVSRLKEASGSSPLSRGIRPHGQQMGYGGGIIPALAGNTKKLTKFATHP